MPGSMVRGMAGQPMPSVFKFTVHFGSFNSDHVLSTSPMLQSPVYFRNYLKMLFWERNEKTALSFSQWKLKPMLQKIFLLLPLSPSLLINFSPMLCVLSICVAHPSRSRSPYFFLSSVNINLMENSRKDDFIVICILKTWKSQVLA